jgi:hypothetical protein
MLQSPPAGPPKADAICEGNYFAVSFRSFPVNFVDIGPTVSIISHAAVTTGGLGATLGELREDVSLTNSRGQLVQEEAVGVLRGSRAESWGRISASASCPPARYPSFVEILSHDAEETPAKIGPLGHPGRTDVSSYAVERFRSSSRGDAIREGLLPFARAARFYD